MTMLRVKNGACAPLRLRSMLSRPATGITCIVVTTGAPEISVWAIARSSLLSCLLCGLLCRSCGGQILHQRGQFRNLLLGEIGQRRVGRARVAVPHHLVAPYDRAPQY